MNDDAFEEPFGTTAIPTSSAGAGGGDCSTNDCSSSCAVSVQFDESSLEQSVFSNNKAQQPKTEAIAVYEATKLVDNNSSDDNNSGAANAANAIPAIQLNGSNNSIDVNPQFVVYAVKNGLIRVMHRHSAMRALLRGHVNQIVTDITFFHDGDVVGTVGNDKPGHNGQNSTLIVWRVYEKTDAPEIGSERLLEINTNYGGGGAPDLTMS